MTVWMWTEWRAFLAAMHLGYAIAFFGSMAIGWMLTDRVEQWRRARRKGRR
jgi:hypothetical protein